MTVTVCDRNVAAVQLMRQGQYAQAQFVLREALAELASVMPVEGHEREQEAQKLPYVVSERISAISIDSAHISNSNNADAAFAMYKKAFVVGLDECSEVVLSLVIFYNMGVTCHAMGLMSGKSVYFQRALKLYLKVYTLLSEHGEDISNATLLLLATCNNMGHLYSLALNAQGMCSCHQQLQSIIAANQDTNATAAIDPSDLDFFFMTLVLGSIVQGKIPMAPAA